jgi:Flp pilus assembly pilin Flp
MPHHPRTNEQRLLLLANERGAELTEYALLLLFIALVVVGSVALFGNAVLGLYQALLSLWH